MRWMLLGLSLVALSACTNKNTLLNQNYICPIGADGAHSTTFTRRC
jgi:hypothetical protein